MRMANDTLLEECKNFLSTLLYERNPEKATAFFTEDAISITIQSLVAVYSNENRLVALKESIEKTPIPERIVWNSCRAYFMSDMDTLFVGSVHIHGTADNHSVRTFFLITAVLSLEQSKSFKLKYMHQSVPSTSDIIGANPNSHVANFTDMDLGILTRCMTDSLAVMLPNDDLTLLHANENFYNMMGYTESEVRTNFGGRLAAIFSPDDVEAFMIHLNDGVKSGKYEFRYSMRMFHKSGETRYLEVNGAVVECDGERQVYIAGNDITELKRTEQLLKNKQASLDIALELTGGLNFDFDMQTGQMRLSPRLMQEYGMPAKITPHEMVKSEKIHPDYAKSFIDMFERACLGIKRVFCITRVLDNSGSYHWNRVTLRPVLSADNVPLLAIGMVEDITIRREAEITYGKGLQKLRGQQVGSICSFEVNLADCRIERASEFFSSYKNRLDSSFESFVEEFIEKAVHPDDAPIFRDITNPITLEETFNTGKTTVSCEFRHKSYDDKLTFVTLTVHILRDPVTGKLNAMATMVDSDKKSFYDSRDSYLAKWDPITGLCTQAYAERIIRERLSVGSGKAKSAFLIIEVDSSACSDAEHQRTVLPDVAGALHENFCFSDLVGYCKNGRFIAFMQNVQSTFELNSRLEIITKNISAAIRCNKVTLAIGAVMCGAGGERLQSIYQSAFTALKYAERPIGFAISPSVVTDTDYDSLVYNLEHIHSSDGFLPEYSTTAQNIAQQILDTIDDPIYISDIATYELLYVNKSAMKLYAIDENNYIGKKCYEVIYGEKSPCAFCTNKNLHGDEFYVWEHVNNTIGRKYFMRDKLILVGKRQAKVEFAIDITEHQLRMNKSYAPVEEIVIPTFVHDMAHAETAFNVVEIALMQAAKYYGAERAFIADISLDTLEFCTRQEWCSYGITQQRDQWHGMRMDGCGNFLSSILSRADLIVDDVEDLRYTSPIEYDIFKRGSITSTFAHPFDLANNEKISYIGLNNLTRNSDERRFLTSVGYFLGQELLKRQMSQQLDHKLRHDSLTELPGHDAYSKRVDELSSRDLVSLGVFMADINGLKAINEQNGHSAGDKIIRSIADIIARHFGREDVFRADSDEFIVLSVDETDDEFGKKSAECRRELDGFEGAGISTGSTWSDLETHPVNMIKHADDLMLAAKQSYYNRGDKNARRRRPQELKKLLDMIKAGQFHMFLQPQVDIRSGDLIGAESLVRLIVPGQGIIPPALFIEPLEKERLIRYLDMFMFEEACKTIAKWKKSGKKLIPISVNFSRLTLLETDLVTSLESIMTRYDAPRAMLKIEITETVGEMEREILSDIGRKLNGAGFGICLDDFGTRYTNISMLSVMRFEVLKLDRSMVNNLASNENSCIVASFVVDMCHRMGVTIIAEGVETEEQRLLLENMGCHMAQGYLFGRPTSLEDFEKILDKSSLITI